MMCSRLLEMLKDGNHSLVVENKYGIEMFNRQGLADLLGILAENPAVLDGADVADKVVGKAAAALMVLGGVDSVEALVMSESAKAMLEAHGVASRCGTLVDHIWNRAGTGWCPMELCCRDCRTPEECRIAIEKKIQEFKNQKQ